MGTTVRLVREAQAGDRKALNALLGRYLPRVRQIAALRMGRRLRQITEIEDIVQGAFIKVLEGLKRFEETTEGGFLNWLARCVECEIVDAARHRRAAKRGGGRIVRFGDCGSEVVLSTVFAKADPGPSPSQMLQAKELSERIEEALLALPSHYREVVTLRTLCGMSYREIAQTLGLGSEATARKAVSRAMRKLKDCIRL